MIVTHMCCTKHMLYVCIYMQLLTYVCMCVVVCMCARRIFIYMCVCVCMSVFIHVCLRAHMSAVTAGTAGAAWAPAAARHLLC